LLDAPRRRRPKAGIALEEEPGIEGVQPVDIFLRSNRDQGALGIKVIGQRQLDDHPVIGGVVVYTLDQLK
jgi:hypothetical protein